MKMIVSVVLRTLETWWYVVMVVVTIVAVEVTSLNGPNVCMVKQKYNITKRVKYRAPMSIRTYEWCFSMPPRCSKWSTEMKDLTRLETEERTAEVAVCCPGYKMKDISCVPICPYGKTGNGCLDDCPPNKWGPNCVNDCKNCSSNGICSSINGECQCKDGWQGESCEMRMITTTNPTTIAEELLTTSKAPIKTVTQQTIEPISSPTFTTIETSTAPDTTPIVTTFHSTSKLTTMSSVATEEKFTLAVSSVTSSKQKQYDTMFDNHTLNSVGSIIDNLETQSTRTFVDIKSHYNRTEAPVDTTNYTIMTNEKAINKTESSMNMSETKIIFSSTTAPTKIITTVSIVTTEKILNTSTALIPEESWNKTEITKRPDTTFRNYPTTIKFKPKEIWIRPAQKGEQLFVESKTKQIIEPQLRYGNSTKKELVTENTTPKTIVVSIIPTSISYSTFKKIALTTASYLAQKSNLTNSSHRSTEVDFTKSLSAASTTAPFTIKILSTKSSKKSIASTANSLLPQNTTNSLNTSLVTKGSPRLTKVIPITSTSNLSNSMITLNAVNTKTSPNIITTTPSTNVQHIPEDSFSIEIVSSKKAVPITSSKTTPPTTEKASTDSTLIYKQFMTVQQKQTTNKLNTNKIEVTDRTIPINTVIKLGLKTNETKTILTNVTNNITTTDVPSDEETFHILTEPEHITAVMGEKETERSSVDLISVISIAGGVMMAVITVAVVIVMIERCKRPRYEDVRKVNNIRMEVMIDNNDVPPPPYVRSIFHTPLPDPPVSEKCHYQPISTLDRNLKQFMRPVVVQTISPIMLENFRGILECHYDHLPRRSHNCHDFDKRQTCCSVSPSVNECDELRRQQRLSVAESAIEAMKREAKLDVIDTTTSEPLYAEIPCWRPPSEHAIEIVNMNGEAVTEL